MVLRMSTELRFGAIQVNYFLLVVISIRYPMLRCLNLIFSVNCGLNTNFTQTLYEGTSLIITIRNNHNYLYMH
jgi:hypothetical protein